MNQDKYQSTEKLAIIAGSGDLPIIVTDKLIEKNINFIILCLDNDNQCYFHENEKTKNYKIFPVDLTDLSNISSILKHEEIRNVICCGGIKFCGFKKSCIFNFRSFVSNFKLIIYAISIIFARQKGDNFLLTIAEKALRTINCKIIAVQDILPDLLCKKTDEINEELAKKYKKDIDYGIQILDALSQYDIGQSVVIYDGRVLGIEGAEGTQELIKRCHVYYLDIIKKLSNTTKKPILIKKSKINQNKKLDVPTIGNQTIIDLIENDFAGIAIENDNVFILHKPEVLKTCQENNLFLANF